MLRAAKMQRRFFPAIELHHVEVADIGDIVVVPI